MIQQVKGKSTLQRLWERGDRNKRAQDKALEIASIDDNWMRQFECGRHGLSVGLVDAIRREMLAEQSQVEIIPPQPFNGQEFIDALRLAIREELAPFKALPAPQPPAIDKAALKEIVAGIVHEVVDEVLSKQGQKPTPLPGFETLATPPQQNGGPYAEDFEIPPRGPGRPRKEA